MTDEATTDEAMLARFDACRPMLDELPLPGAGATLERWRAMGRLAREDLSLARLAEGHADTRAILVELGRYDLLERRGPVGRLGVWAAEPGRLRAEPIATGWRLDGAKGWCSGSVALDGALVTATAPDGPRLFHVSPAHPSISAEAGSWEPLGMAPTRSETLRFHAVELAPAAAIGEPAAYTNRPGFGHGGAGVTACWWGGAHGVLDALERAVTAGADDDTAAALGSATAGLDAAWSCLTDAAAEIDEHPHDRAVALRIANRVRLVAEAAAQQSLRLTVEALGAAGLCHDPEHAGRVADLTVYLSQMRRRSAAVFYGRAVAGRRIATL